jgi:hypothetical protein
MWHPNEPFIIPDMPDEKAPVQTRELPRRWKEMLRLKAFGHSTKDAARIMGIREGTVNGYVSLFKERYFVRSHGRSDLPLLVAAALEFGVVTPEELIENLRRVTK